MRFAYIDSHGNEVPIPSVDALALRIELGAIGPDTQLYDAQADHWGPASTHEIFHTLSRQAQGDGFVAPPPVAPPPVAPPPPAAVPAPKAEKPKPKPKAEPKPEPAAKSATDLGLTLAAPAPPPPKKAAPEPEPAAGGLDLTLDLAPPAAPSKSKGPSPAGAADGGGTFDYGDLSSGLQLEEESPVQPAASGMGGAMSFDTPMQFGGGGAGGGNDLQLEQPMSAFTPDSPPGWMEQEAPPGSGGDLLGFSTVPAAAEAAAAPVAPVADAPDRTKRPAKDRPSAPKFKEHRSLAGPIVVIVLLLAVGVGGYVGWPLLQARLAQEEEPVVPVRVMPALAPELVPRMRELAEGAVATAIAEVDANTRTDGAPTEPDQRWLGGNYLANANQFASIEAFWSSIGAFMDGVRAADPGLYHDKLVEGAQAAGLGAEESAQIVERADSGFAFATATRDEVYATLDGVVDAALALHQYLVENEANIEYRPASTSTADPILEAVPSSTAIGDRMLELVDGVTEGLSDLMGTLDRVTRERLVTALTGRIQQVGIQ